MRDANSNLAPVRDQKFSDRQAVIILRSQTEVWCQLTTELPLDNLQSNFRTGADSQVVGQVDPANDSGGVNQKLGRACDVTAILTRFGMQDAVTANHLRVRIGQERIFVTSGMAKFAGLFGRIDTDRGDFKAVLMKLVELFFEPP